MGKKKLDLKRRLEKERAKLSLRRVHRPLTFVSFSTMQFYLESWIDIRHQWSN
ncbi:hypothetical protein CPB83DRAFT_859749 [Crepidotus variabilis]|uniref:Uncharacterized protein n=1 Tax=Crepidotus variabilis TaxID=179855 RepID=A0A9P6JLF0_9AGAR|nr:hypothetical protein CPB83DRAFT_859749 [Crepidotus variabilis]